MKRRGSKTVAGMLLLGGSVLTASVKVEAALPENLAPKAKATATSEHNQQYLARFATDGKIPPAGSTAADRGTA